VNFTSPITCNSYGLLLFNKWYKSSTQKTAEKKYIILATEVDLD